MVAFTSLRAALGGRKTKRVLIKFKIFEMVRVRVCEDDFWTTSQDRATKWASAEQPPVRVREQPATIRLRQLSHGIHTCEHTVRKCQSWTISIVVRYREKSMSLITYWHTGIATSNVCASVSPVIRPHSHKNRSYRSRHRADNWECVTIIPSSRLKFRKWQYDSRRTCLLSHGNRYSRADKAWMYVLQLVAKLWHREERVDN